MDVLKRVFFELKERLFPAFRASLLEQVAVLIHDFPDQCGGADQAQTSRTYSVTLYGVCVVETAAAAETYRQIHLANNPGYAQFIKGDDIIIVTIAVESAAICNIDDEVQYWDVLKGLRSTK